MPAALGIRFKPDEQQSLMGPMQGQKEGLQQAIQMVSLRYPRVIGSRSITDPSLLAGGGRPTTSPTFNPDAAIFRALIAAFAGGNGPLPESVVPRGGVTPPTTPPTPPGISPPTTPPTPPGISPPTTPPTPPVDPRRPPRPPRRPPPRRPSPPRPPDPGIRPIDPGDRPPLPPTPPGRVWEGPPTPPSPPIPPSPPSRPWGEDDPRGWKDPWGGNNFL